LQRRLHRKVRRGTAGGFAEDPRGSTRLHGAPRGSMGLHRAPWGVEGKEQVEGRSVKRREGRRVEELEEE